MNINAGTPEWSKDILCRNISVYGFCKNESTCIYNHGDRSTGNMNSETQTSHDNSYSGAASPVSSHVSAVDAFKQAALSAANKKKAPETTQNSVGSTAAALKQIALNAVSKSKDSSASGVTSSTPDAPVSASKLLLQKALEKKGLSFSETKQDDSAVSGFNFMRPGTPPVVSTSLSGHSPMLNSPITSAGSAYQQSPVMGQVPPMFNAPASTPFIATTPSQSNMNFMATPNQTSTIFSSAHTTESEKSFFIDESLKHLIQNNNLDMNNFPLNSNIPLVVQDYTNLSLMWQDRDSKNYYYKCKKLDSSDNKTYLMHRVSKLNSSQLPLPRDITNINKSNHHLKSVDSNSNILKLESTFVTASFMDNSLCHVYHYYPLMVQMNEFLQIDPLGSGVCQMQLNDLWFVLFQLLNFVKFLIENKLHLANGIKEVEDFISFDNFFIILNSDNSFVLKYKNLGDILVNKCLKDHSGVVKPNKGFGANVPVASCLNKVGLIWKNLVVSCNSLVNNAPVNEAIKYLRGEDVELEQVSKVFEFSRLSSFFNQLQSFNELTFENLSKNFNNETFLKIIIKLNVVMSDYSDKNPSWLPNGSKYPLKLFFDYIFNSQYSKLKTLNYGHIIKNLSKLDSGIYENCILASSDKTTCLLINFRDLKMLVNVNYNIMINKGNEQF